MCHGKLLTGLYLKICMFGNSVPDGFQKILLQNTKRNVWDLHIPFWSATRRTAMSFSYTSLPVMKHGYPISPQKVGNSPCTGVTHHPPPPPKKKKNSSRLSALAKSCARYSETVMEFCSLITAQMDKHSMSWCTATPYNAYAELFKTNAGDYSAPGWFFSTTKPVRTRLGKQQPYCSNFVGIS